MLLSQRFLHHRRLSTGTAEPSVDGTIGGNERGSTRLTRRGTAAPHDCGHDEGHTFSRPLRGTAKPVVAQTRLPLGFLDCGPHPGGESLVKGSRRQVFERRWVHQTSFRERDGAQRYIARQQ